ncbi:MAG: lysozyme inhibitor LprI family protein [Pseudomonadota bacterium]|nr:lysozyme inhibitor LprI family protein [Pseudomonadota bacterium]
MRARLIATLLCLSIPALPATARPHEAACAKLLNTPLPAEQRATARSDCDPQALYFGRDGQGSTRDYAAARQCGWARRTVELANDDWSANEGIGVLMMIYANGHGTAQNLSVARRLACEYGGAPAEISGRLNTLDGIARHPALVKAQPFDVCDDITSGAMMGWCSRRDAQFADQRRDSEWQSVMRDMPPAQSQALAELRTSGDTFFALAARHENDMSGTMRGAIANGAEQELRNQLLAEVKQLQAQPAPIGHTDFKHADQALNTAWKALLQQLAKQNAADHYPGSINATDLRSSQRAWLHYRDAWARFGHALYPATAADVFRAQETARRTRQLQEMLVPED